MNAYQTLASVYDRLTGDVDYESFVDFYMLLLRREGLQPETALDLACGTGSVAIALAKRGLRVTGVDLSADMLCMAAQKAQELPAPPMFVQQSMQSLRLPRAVDLVVSALDGIDYLLDPEDCKKTLCRVYKALNPGGCFIFDVNTPEKLRAMDGQVFVDEDEDLLCLWRGEFDRATNICSYGMDLFFRQGGLWRREFEEHREYAYSALQLVPWLKEAGFTSVEVYGDRVAEPPRPGEQRIFIKARKGKIK